MPPPKLDIHLDDDILGDLLFLAKHAGRIEELVNLAGESPLGLRFMESVRFFAKKSGLPVGDVERLLTTVHNILRTQMRIGTAQFLDTVTRAFEEKEDDEELQTWKQAVGVIREQTGKIGPDHPSGQEDVRYIKDLWIRSDYSFVPVSHTTDEEWLAERARYSLLVLRDCVELNPGKRGGIPVLRGTRYTVSQLFAEISEGRSIIEIAEDFDLDVDLLRQVLEGFSIQLDRPLAK